MKRFEGRVAVVTGGARGIGLATAERFAAEGAKVAILDLPGAEGEEAAARLNAEGSEAAFHGCDVSDRNAVEETFATVARDFGGIDILHANAGIHRGNDFLNVPVDEWDLVIDTNLKSVLLCGQAAARRMIEQGRGGAIVNTSSIAAILASGGDAAYAASKAAIVSLTKSMALTLAPHNIRVNAVGPGTIVTGMTSSLLQDANVRKFVLARIPAGRFAEPRDVAGAVAFFASDDAAYITAQTLYIEGGRLALNFTVPVRENA